MLLVFACVRVFVFVIWKFVAKKKGQQQKMKTTTLFNQLNNVIISVIDLCMASERLCQAVAFSIESDRFDARTLLMLILCRMTIFVVAKQWLQQGNVSKDRVKHLDIEAYTKKEKKKNSKLIIIQLNCNRFFCYCFDVRFHYYLSFRQSSKRANAHSVVSVKTHVTLDRDRIRRFHISDLAYEMCFGHRTHTGATFATLLYIKYRWYVSVQCIREMQYRIEHESLAFYSELAFRLPSLDFILSLSTEFLFFFLYVTEFERLAKCRIVLIRLLFFSQTFRIISYEMLWRILTINQKCNFPCFPPHHIPFRRQWTWRVLLCVCVLYILCNKHWSDVSMLRECVHAENRLTHIQLYSEIWVKSQAAIHSILIVRFNLM